MCSAIGTALMVSHNMAWRLVGGKRKRGGREGEAFCIHARFSINDDVFFPLFSPSFFFFFDSFSPHNHLFPHVTPLFDFLVHFFFFFEFL